MRFSRTILAAAVAAACWLITPVSTPVSEAAPAAAGALGLERTAPGSIVEQARWRRRWRYRRVRPLYVYYGPRRRFYGYRVYRPRYRYYRYRVYRPRYRYYRVYRPRRYYYVRRYRRW